jgi:hypothetical protein
MIKKFEKELLYQKDASLLIKKYNENIVNLQHLQNEIELLTKRPMKDPELGTLANSPHDFVKDLKEKIKAKFQFKDASEQFNLDSKGISYINLDKAIANIPVNDFRYQVINECIEPMKAEIDRLEDSMKVYTKSQFQNDILNVCRDLCKDFEKLDRLYPIGAAYEIQRGTNNLLKVGWNEAGKPMPVVNYEMVEHI